MTSPNPTSPNPASSSPTSPNPTSSSPTSTAHPIFVLVRPQLGENIGMSARAMLNCGYQQMRLVAPRDGWPNQAAIDAASGATQVIDGAICYETTKDALADCQHVFALSARRRDLQLPHYSPDELVRETAPLLQKGEKIALLFGPERSGLDNDDIAHARGLVSFALNPNFKSLNLSQAVLLMAWQYWQASADYGQIKHDLANMGHRQDSPPASLNEIDNLFTRLMAGIKAGGFLHNPEMLPLTERNLRVMLARAQPSEQEIRTLHGVIRALRAAPALDDTRTQKNNDADNR